MSLLPDTESDLMATAGIDRNQLIENLLQAIAEDMEQDGLMAYLADDHPIMEAYKALVVYDQDTPKS